MLPANPWLLDLCPIGNAEGLDRISVTKHNNGRPYKAGLKLSVIRVCTETGRPFMM